MNNNQMSAKGVGLLIHDVARLLRNRIDQRAHAVGLTSAQWRVLSVIARAEFKNEEPPNQAALADQMDLEPITLSRLVDRMEAAGMIERRPATPPTAVPTGSIFRKPPGRWSRNSATSPPAVCPMRWSASARPKSTRSTTY